MSYYFDDDSSFSDTFSRRHFYDITQKEKDDAIEYVLGRSYIPFSLTEELYNYIDQQLENLGVCILSNNTLDNILSKYGFKISERIGSKSVIISRHGLIKG